MKRYALFLPQPLIDRLRKLAGEQDVSVSELIRKAIEVFLKKK